MSTVMHPCVAKETEKDPIMHQEMLDMRAHIGGHISPRYFGQKML